MLRNNRSSINVVNCYLKGVERLVLFEGPELHRPVDRGGEEEVGEIKMALRKSYIIH